MFSDGGGVVQQDVAVGLDGDHFEDDPVGDGFLLCGGDVQEDLAALFGGFHVHKHGVTGDDIDDGGELLGGDGADGRLQEDLERFGFEGGRGGHGGEEGECRCVHTRGGGGVGSLFGRDVLQRGKIEAQNDARHIGVGGTNPCNKCGIIDDG